MRPTIYIQNRTITIKQSHITTVNRVLIPYFIYRRCPYSIITTFVGQQFPELFNLTDFLTGKKRVISGRFIRKVAAPYKFKDETNQ